MERRLAIAPQFRPVHAGQAAPLAVGVLALLSAAAAVVMSRAVFPHLSVDNDETIYRLHADALAHGHLFVPAPPVADAFRPWLAAVSGDHYVLKYSALFPALLAASHVLTGGYALALGAVAAGVVVMTWLLAREVLGRDGEALLAAALVAMSPLVLVQSGLLLAYMPVLLLLETFAWGVLRGLATGRHRPLALGGLAFGLAFAMRPYDAVLFGAPVALWVVLRRSGPRPSLRAVAAFAAPTTVGLACFLLWNAAATGSPFRLPFSALEPDDTLGFGVRRLYPTDEGYDFGLRQGLSGVVRHGALLGRWVAGGVLLLVLAGVGVVRRTARGRATGLAAVAVVLPLGYVFFWGPWNATVLWGGTRYVGPFYFLPVVVPVAVFAARALGDLARWRRGAAVLAGVAVVCGTAATMVVVVDENRAFTRHNRAIVDLVDGAGRSPKLVYAAMPTPFLMHESPVIANRWDLSGPVVYALARGDGDLDVAGLHPGRAHYRLEWMAAYRRPDERFGARLERLALVKGAPRVDLSVVARWAPSPNPVEVVVAASGTARAYRFAGGAGPTEIRERLVVTPQGAELAGRAAAREWREPASAAGLTVRVRRIRSGAPPIPLGEERLPLRSDGPTLEVLVPDGRVWTAGRPPPPALELSHSSGG
ncbi:MAG TPA: glycosyltransferase family 39 protein [Acidimicrobiales bacterium]|nr:glycosyltransferase family 39 protein [Acidimicrobiales bacterium]